MYGYRYYSPEIGRFLSRDPLGDEAFLRRYTSGMSKLKRRQLRQAALEPTYVYVGNEPISHADFLGLMDLKIGWSCSLKGKKAKIQSAYDSLMALLKDASSDDDSISDIINCLQTKDSTIKVKCGGFLCCVSGGKKAASAAITLGLGSFAICESAWDPKQEWPLETILAVEMAKNGCGLSLFSGEYKFAKFIKGLVEAKDKE